MTGRRLRSLLLLASAVAFCAIAAWQLAAAGPFGASLGEPQTLQGGLEAALLIGLMAGCARLRDPRWRWTAWLLLGATYARRHAVDLPLVVDVCLLAIIVPMHPMRDMLVERARAEAPRCRRLIRGATAPVRCGESRRK